VKNPASRPMIAAQSWLDRARVADWLAPLLLRAYLVPVFWMAGMQKATHFADTVEWFGNADWGLGLPFPWLMAFFATATELVGAACLALGFALRWMTLPMMTTMIVAAITVHLPHGWLAIAEGMGPFANMRTMEASERLVKIKEILMQHGDYGYLTEHGSVVVLNNGVEFAATYFVMLLALFFIGAGRYVSVDYWLRRHHMGTA
jgi:putative oxidoreductase